LKKWNLTSGELVRIVFVILTIVIGLFLVGRSIVTGEYNNIHISIGSVLVIFGLVGGLSHMRDIKRSRKVSAK